MMPFSQSIGFSSTWIQIAEFESFFVLGLLFVVLALSAVYLVRVASKGRARFERVERQGGSIWLGKSLMEMGYWWMQPIAKFLVLSRISANAISWTSLVFGFFAGLCFAFGHFGFGGFFSIIAGFMDALDGLVAKLSNQVSESGEVLDATIDRVNEGFLFVGLSVYYAHYPVLVLACGLALMGSYLVSYSSARAMILKVDLPSGAFRRPERMLYLVLGAILSPISIFYFEQIRSTPKALGFPMVTVVLFLAIFTNLSSFERFRQLTRILDHRKKK